VSTELLILVIVIIDAVVCGCLSFSLAKKKGHDAGAWFACGFFFGILGLIAAAGLPTVRAVEGSDERKRCPDCAERVCGEALVCPYCRHQFTPEDGRTALLATLESEDPEVRSQAIEGLSGQAGQGILTRLLEALGDPDVNVRVAAVEALERVGDKSIAPHVVGVLEHAREDFAERDTYFMLEAAAGKALRVLATETIVPRLAALAQTPGESQRKRLAVQALGSIAGSEAIRTLVGLLGDEHAAEQAATALASIGAPAIPQLEQVGEQDSRSVRKTAKKLLESIRSKQPE